MLTCLQIPTVTWICGRNTSASRS